MSPPGICLKVKFICCSVKTLKGQSLKMKQMNAVFEIVNFTAKHFFHTIRRNKSLNLCQKNDSAPYNSEWLIYGFILVVHNNVEVILSGTWRSI